jgi:type IV fimbrial biogenesis protein FimT
MRRRSSGAGYTLFELLLTITIAAIVLAAGVPSMGDLVARSRQSAEVNALFHAIHLARKESIMRRLAVSLCPSADGRRCRPGMDWSAGWIMFENRDRDEPPTVDDGEPVLERHTVDPGIRLTSNRRGYTLRATVLRATNGTLVACDTAGRIPPKALVVSWTGRPRVALETTDGEPYACAD